MGFDPLTGLSTTEAGAFSKLDAVSPPLLTNNFSEGYVVGSLWIDVLNDKVYQCTNPGSAGAPPVSDATWLDLTTAGGGAVPAKERGSIIQYIWTDNGNQSNPTTSFLNTQVSGADDGEIFFDSVNNQRFVYLTFAGGWITLGPAANPTSMLFLNNGSGTYTQVGGGTEVVNQSPDDKVYTWTASLDAGTTPADKQRFVNLVPTVAGAVDKLTFSAVYYYNVNTWDKHNSMSIDVNSVTTGMLTGGLSDELVLRAPWNDLHMVGVNYVIDNPTTGVADFSANITGTPAVGELAYALNANATAKYNNSLSTGISIGDLFILKSLSPNVWEKAKQLSSLGGGWPYVAIPTTCEGLGIVSGASSKTADGNVYRPPRPGSTAITLEGDVLQAFASTNGFAAIPALIQTDTGAGGNLHYLMMAGFMNRPPGGGAGANPIGSYRLSKDDFTYSFDNDRIESIGGGGGSSAWTEKEIEVIEPDTATSIFELTGAENGLNFPASGNPAGSFSFVARAITSGDIKLRFNYDMFTPGAATSGVASISAPSGILGSESIADGTYNLSVDIDGAGAADIPTGALVSQTVLDAVNGINGNLTGATIAIVGGEIVVTSVATGITSTIVLAEGTTLGFIAALDTALAETSVFETPVNGEDIKTIVLELDISRNGVPVGGFPTLTATLNVVGTTARATITDINLDLIASTHFLENENITMTLRRNTDDVADTHPGNFILYGLTLT